MGIEQFFGQMPTGKNPLTEAHRTEAISRLRRYAQSFDPLSSVTVIFKANGNIVGEMTKQGAVWQRQLNNPEYSLARDPGLNKDFDNLEVRKVGER